MKVFLALVLVFLSSCGLEPPAPREVKVALSVTPQVSGGVEVTDSEFLSLSQNPCVALRVCSGSGCRDSSLQRAEVTDTTYSVKLASEVPREGSPPYCVQLVAFREALASDGSLICKRPGSGGAGLELARESWSLSSGNFLKLTPIIKSQDPISYIQNTASCGGTFVSNWDTRNASTGSSLSNHFLG